MLFKQKVAKLTLYYYALEDPMESYTSFARVYDLFMDNVPYEEWCEYLTNLFKENGIEVVAEDAGATDGPKKEVEEVVEARLDEIFGEIRKKLKVAKYDQRLPEGIILVGGGAKMRDIDLFAKQSLEAAVKIGTPKGLGGVADAIEKPEFAAAVGLAMLAAEESQYTPVSGKKAKKAFKMPKTPGFLKKLFSKF